MSKKNVTPEEVKVQEEVKTIEVAKPEAAKSKETAVIYVGPTIVGKITSNTTFKKGIPEVAKEIMKTHPYFKNLFVPIERIAEAKKQLAERNSPLAVFYNKAKTI